MSEELTKVGWHPDGSFCGDDEDYEQWVLDHPDEAQEEEEEEQDHESGFDPELGNYVSKQLLNGQHIITIENNGSDIVEYDGEFVDGMREGEGLYRQMNIYEGKIDFEYNGDFSNNLPEGKGVASWVENGSIVYTIEGNFVNGLPDSKEPCTVTVEHLHATPSMAPASKKTMTVILSHVSLEKPNPDSPNNLLDIYWQGVFELSGLMSDENGLNVSGVFDIHGNVLSQKAGRRSKKSINKNRRNSQKKRI